MKDDSNNLLFTLRDCGRVVSIPKTGELVYELGGKQYRYFLVPERNRHPGEGPWRAEEIVAGSISGQMESDFNKTSDVSGKRPGPSDF